MDNMLKTKKRGNLIVISGPSGAGKDSVTAKVLESMDNIKLSISYTSRKPRGNEENGKDYFFVSKEEFQNLITKGEFLEYAEYSFNYYGTSKNQVNNMLEQGIDVILVIEVQGALQIKNMIEDAIFIFIVPPTMKELKRRLVNRKTDSQEQIFNRFKTAYKEINEYTKYNYVVTNDNLEDAVNKVKAIINAEKCRVDRIIDVDLGNIEEEIHEELIDFN